MMDYASAEFPMHSPFMIQVKMGLQASDDTRIELQQFEQE